MREDPPKKLIELLRRLGLEDRSKIRRAARYARRLARDLPLFESVWVDAMVHAGLLRPFQAQRINQGDGDSLAVGPFVLQRPLSPLGYVDCFAARDRQDQTCVQLAIVSNTPADVDEISVQLSQLAVRHQRVDAAGVLPIKHVGAGQERVWAACPMVEGETVAQRMTRGGRFPADIVLRIASRMTAAMVALHSAGIVHGDLRASSLLVDARGDVHLPLAGLRAVVRPHEGFAFADLQSEAYDGVAPEQIRDAAPMSVATDLYGCGAVWWHMLAGRPPTAGGNTLAKLQTTVAGEIDDVRRWAFDTPDGLALLIADSLQTEPERRPRSADELAARLRECSMSARISGRTTLARQAATARFARRPSRRRLAVCAGLAASITLAAAATWPLWRRLAPSPPAGIGPTTAVVAKSDLGEPSAALGEDASRVPLLPKVSPPKTLLPIQPGQTPLDRLMLSTDGPLDRLGAEAGQTVCGLAGERPTIVVPTTGLIVDREDIVFRNVDFLWQAGRRGQGSQSSATGEALAIVRLEADRASFHGCTFKADVGRTTRLGESAASQSGLPVAIRWIGAPKVGDEPGFVTGRLRVDESVFRHVRLGVDCNLRGAVGVGMHNTLHLGPGPLLRLQRWPTQEDPTAITFSHVTLREAEALIESVGETKPDDLGRLTIEAVNCALQPRSGLLLFTTATDPQAMLPTVRWTGEGALLCGDAPVAVWQAGGGLRTLDDSAMKIAGLIRDKVQFVGTASGPSSSSRLVRWQAPVRSTDPPGILK